MNYPEKIIIATKNKGKAEEFRAIFKDKGIDIETLADYPDLPEVEETGKTFAENALLKAETIHQALGEMVLADDSGLSVDALNGEPGIYSARYAGPEKDDQKNYEKLLANLEAVPEEDRTAHFSCTLALVDDKREPLIIEGILKGRILEEPRGENGFGYDPVFYIPDLGKSSAELSADQKNKISHRGKAIEELLAQFDDWINSAR